MQIFIEDSYDLMSARLAGDVADIVNEKEAPLVCVASGDSPKGLYKEWKRQQEKGTINVHAWNFLALDEWIGLGENDEGSCRYMLNKDLFVPLKISGEKICAFNGKTINTSMECERVENYIIDHGGIDVAILGLGINGHIGLNEPGTSPALYSHVSAIHPVTNAVGQKYFSKPQPLTQGITLGIATLLKAKHLLLVVSGQKKAAILQKALEEAITEEVPASLFRDHSGFKVYADKEAASLIKK